MEFFLISILLDADPNVGLRGKKSITREVTGLSLQKISDALAKAGHLNERGQPYNPKSVRSVIRGARPGRAARYMTMSGMLAWRAPAARHSKRAAVAAD